MTDTQRMQVLLARVAYKPGWKFTLLEKPTSFEVVLSHVGVDPTTGTSVHLAKTTSLSAEVFARMTDQEVLTYFIRGGVLAAELHELDEWFKVDGKCFVDPHPERRKAE